MHRPIIALLAVLAVAGCRGRRQAAERAHAPLPPRREILQAVPVFTISLLTDTTGTPETEQRAYGTLATVDSVRAFYRDTLPRLGWEMQAAQGTAQSATMYATRDSSALWIRIWLDGPQVRFALIGSTIRPGTTGDTLRVPRTRSRR